MSKNQYDYEKKFRPLTISHSLPVSLAIPKPKCRAQAFPRQYQQSEASPVLFFARSLIIHAHICQITPLPVILIWHWTHRYWIRRVTTCLIPYVHIHNSRFSHTYLIRRLAPAGQTFYQDCWAKWSKSCLQEWVGGCLNVKTSPDSVWVLAKRSLPAGTYPGPENTGGILRCWKTSLRSEAHEYKWDQPQGWDSEGRER